MKTHNFKIIVSGVDPEAADFADRFYNAGCDDATLSVQKGLVVLDFDREARTFLGAVSSALADVQKAGATIERIEPDYLVNASDIAKRVGLGRAAISLYASGLRESDFPRPVARVTSESPLWDWAEVCSWLYHRNKISLSETIEARTLRDYNRIVTGARDHGDSLLAKRLAKAQAPAQLRI